MNMPGGITASIFMGHILPCPVVEMVSASPVVRVGLRNMVRLVDTFNRVGVFHPLVMPEMMSAIVRMLMDMPVMVTAINGMSGNVPSPVVVIVAAGGTVEMDRPLDRPDAYSTPYSDQK